MPYYTGTASSLSDLLTALQTHCVAEGWTLTGNILDKGGCYVEAKVANLNNSGNLRPALVIRPGNSRSGSTLADAAPSRVFLGTFSSAVTESQITFPATYYLHIFSSPDEVFLVLNYETDYYQWLAFGKSGVTGLAGTGNWSGATLGTGPDDSQSTATNKDNRWSSSPRIYITDTQGGNLSTYGDHTSAALLWMGDNESSPIGQPNRNGLVHTGYDAYNGGWAWPNSPSSTEGSTARSIPMISDLVSRQPSAWNGQIVLLPIQVYTNRASSKWSLAIEVANARYAMLDHYAPEEIITIGSDEWKLYPWYRRNIPKTDFDSGRYGWAIRYDGP